MSSKTKHEGGPLLADPSGRGIISAKAVPFPIVCGKHTVERYLFQWRILNLPWGKGSKSQTKGDMRFCGKGGKFIVS